MLRNLADFTQICIDDAYQDSKIDGRFAPEEKYRWQNSYGSGFRSDNELGGIRMIHENEVVMLMLGVGVLVFVLESRTQLKQLPAPRTLISAFYVLLAGWMLTVLEGFFWEATLNYLEHLCYAVSAVLVTVWCWRVFLSKKEAV
jgi:hypothetical protein